MLAVGKGGYSALRRGRASAPGQVYLITWTTFERRRLFDDFARAVRMSRSISGLPLWVRHHLLCWVLMPDHMHLLVELGVGEDLPLLVQKSKGCTSRTLRSVEADIGPIWAIGFHDHAVRNDESLVEVARYVIANPVRAGLVARAGLYPFWNARWLDSATDRD